VCETNVDRNLHAAHRRLMIVVMVSAVFSDRPHYRRFAVLEAMFGDRILSRSLWLASSLDLTSCYILWCNLKNKFYRTPHRSRVKGKHTKMGVEVPREEVLWANSNVFNRYRKFAFVQGDNSQPSYCR
jgi:hypothetical protein